MCGRYFLFAPTSQILEQFEIENEDKRYQAYPARYNIAPGQTIHTIILDNNQPVFELKEWRFLPAWSDTNKNRTLPDKNQAKSLAPKISPVINARAEGIETKPFFRSAIRYHRCLIPANGFYEWQHSKNGKIPFVIGASDLRLIAFAGIWEAYHDELGRYREGVAIITRTAGQSISHVHERMPVILSKEDYAAWLTGQDGKIPLYLLTKNLEWDLCAKPADIRVNKPENDYQELLAGFISQ